MVDYRGCSTVRLTGITPTGTPPVFLDSLSAILENQACYRRRSRIFAGVDGQIDGQEEQDLRTG